MNVLYVTTYYKPAYQYGGPVRSISALCEGLVKIGVNVSVMTTNINGRSRLDVSIDRVIDLGGVAVSYYPVNLEKYVYSSRLSKAIREQAPNYDIVEVQSLWAQPLITTAQTCLENDIPYIIPLHGQLLPWSMGYKGLKKSLYLRFVSRKLINKASGIHCTTREETSNLSELNISSPAFVVPNGLDTEKFLDIQERSRFRNSLNIPSDDILFLFVGRLHQKKRPDIAFHAFVNAYNVYKNVHLLIAGPDEGGWKIKLKSQADLLGLSDRIHFTGLLKGDEIIDAYACADLLLMPSEPESENFGMSAVESMAAGVPILVSDGVPIGDDAERAGAGKVVPCEPEAFAAATIEMVSDWDCLRQMGHAGKKHVQHNYDSVVVARHMLGQYRSVIETGRPE